MTFAIRRDRLEPVTFKERIHRFISKSHNAAEVEKVVTYLRQNPSLLTANALINSHQNDASVAPLLSSFDREMSEIYCQREFHHPINRKQFKKWAQAGLSEEIFRKFPRFVTFLFEANLIHQIKVARGDALSVVENVPFLLVEGQWIRESELYDRFEIFYSQKYKQKFLIEKATRMTYTYLDNGQGLQKFDPYLSDPAPISHLNEPELLSVMEKGALFIRPEEREMSGEERAIQNQQRPFILQIVNVIDQKGTTNFSKNISNPRHVYLRLVVGKELPDLNMRKGDVFSIGLERAKEYFLPFELLDGRFRSPDVFEYMDNDQKVVTNIPIDKEGARSLFTYWVNTKRDHIRHGKTPKFHILQQNCTVFTKAACRAAGIDLPTEVTLPDLISKIAPDWIHKIGEQFQQIRREGLTLLEKPLTRDLVRYLQKICDRIHDIWRRFLQAFASFLVLPIRMALGDGLGTSGRGFDRINGIPISFDPPLQNPRTYFDFRVHMPAQLHEWQLLQPSTMIFEHPPKLAIV